MTEWFIEVLNRKDEWVKYDGKAYESYSVASQTLHEDGLFDHNCWYRIVPEFDPRYLDYGPCH